MIFQNIELHNVSELTPAADGKAYTFHRAPVAVESTLSDSGKRMNQGGTGVELRFEVLSEAGVDITMRLLSDVPLARVIPVYYGNIVTGWQECRKVVFNTPTRIHVAQPANMPMLERIHRENGFPFDPHVVRLMLPVSSYEIISVEGDVCPPKPEHLPAKRLLTYGSSITHGSLSLLPMGSYVFRTAENLGMDIINMGYAGAARMEKSMAEFIASRQDWDVATLEMGINSLDMSEELFTERVHDFITTIANAHPRKPVFAIDIFFCDQDMNGKTKVNAFRDIVKREVASSGLPNLHYLPGLEIMTIGSAGLSGDFVHPNLRGHENMALNLTRLINRILQA